VLPLLLDTDNLRYSTDKHVLELHINYVEQRIGGRINKRRTSPTSLLKNIHCFTSSHDDVAHRPVGVCAVWGMSLNEKCYVTTYYT